MRHMRAILLGLLSGLALTACARVTALEGPPQDDAVIVPRVGVLDRLNFCFRDVPCRTLHQRRMQAPLGHARFLDRVKLRAQIVGAQEVVGDPKFSGRVAF